MQLCIEWGAPTFAGTSLFLWGKFLHSHAHANCGCMHVDGGDMAMLYSGLVLLLDMLKNRSSARELKSLQSIYTAHSCYECVSHGIKK